MTRAEARRLAAARLAAAGIDAADGEALRLLEAATGLDRQALLLDAARPLDRAEAARLAALLTRREAREPLQHVVGTAPFYGLELRSGPEALVPRPETEALVELALARLAGTERPRVLDVGTGSGAIALAVKAERPDAAVVATDVAPAALALARRNAAELGLEVAFVASDLLAAPAAAAAARRADLLVANPPYLPEADRAAVAPEVRRDPAGALFAGPDGLAVWRRLEREAAALLRPGARLLVELDPRNAGRALDEALVTGAWARGERHADLAGRARFVELERGD